MEPLKELDQAAMIHLAMAARRMLQGAHDLAFGDSIIYVFRSLEKFGIARMRWKRVKLKKSRKITKNHEKSRKITRNSNRIPQTAIMLLQ
jgi:hypothetical protein